jgi:hypothetical protein
MFWSDFTPKSDEIGGKCNPHDRESLQLSENLLYRKIQISFPFFEKIAIEIECFLQNLTNNHEIFEA